MSNFNCEHCGTAIIDSPRGYITSCEHHKAENINKFLSRHIEGDCHHSKSVKCRICEYGPIEKLINLAESQVDILPDFRIVLNELASNNLDVNNRGKY